MTDPTPGADTLTGTDREIAYVCIDVQRGAIGILTAVRRIRALMDLRYAVLFDTAPPPGKPVGRSPIADLLP